MKTISNYSIYCTPKQARTAFELGAPIFPIKSRRTKETVISSDDVISYDEDFFTYVTNPTAEEMIGWLETQGICFNIRKQWTDNLYVVGWLCNGRQYAKVVEKSSRSEAILTAISDALEYLSKNKK